MKHPSGTVLRQSMARRFSSGGGVRRALRSEGYDDASSQSTYSILGSILVEEWSADANIALVGGDVDSWTGLVGGKVLSQVAGNRPVYAADGSNFKGRLVVQCVSASSKLLQGAALSLLGTGKRPYIAAIYRFTAIPASDTTVLYFSDSGNQTATMRQSGGTTSRARFNLGGIVATGSSAPDTSVHFEEAWCNASTGIHLMFDGGADQVNGSGTGTTTTAFSEVTVGATYALGEKADIAIAWFCLCSSEPTAAQRTQLLSWARSTWGTP